MIKINLRALTKTGIANALHWSGAARPLSAMAGWQSAPPVVTYHRVVADFAAHAQRTAPANLVSSRMLEHHLDWIGRRFRFVSLDELGSHLEGRRTGARPVAAVTFDDGYRDVYEHAFPLLRRKGIPAAIFVVTRLIGTSELQLHDRFHILVTRALAAWKELDVRWAQADWMAAVSRQAISVARILYDRLPQSQVLRICEVLETQVGLGPADTLSPLLPLTWDMLAEMQRAGMTIGSHTLSHALLTNESSDKVMEETADSRRELECRLGITVDHFAYPAGRFDSHTVRAVAEAGYRFAYTTCAHRDQTRPLLTIPRRMLWQNSSLNALGQFSSTMMSCQVKGSFDLGRGCNQRHVDRVRRRPQESKPKAAVSS
jgi:peptidoglycan/xylan/chitin deacetylase (PgdA/CDA1 family)